jgi:hypothetical protein
MLGLDLSHINCLDILDWNVYKRLVSGKATPKDIYKTVLVSFYECKELELELELADSKEIEGLGKSGDMLVDKLFKILNHRNKIFFDVIIIKGVHNDILFASTEHEMIIFETMKCEDIGEVMFRSSLARYKNNYKNVYIIGLLDSSLGFISL